MFRRAQVMPLSRSMRTRTHLFGRCCPPLCKVLSALLQRPPAALSCRRLLATRADRTENMGRERGWVSVQVRTYHSHRSSSAQQPQRVQQQDYTVDESGATLNAVSRSSDAQEEERLQAQLAAASSTTPTTSIIIRDWKVRVPLPRGRHGRPPLWFSSNIPPACVARCRRFGWNLCPPHAPPPPSPPPTTKCPTLSPSHAHLLGLPAAAWIARAALWPPRVHPLREGRQLVLVQPCGRRAPAEQQHPGLPV